MTAGFIMQTLICVISMEFLPLSHRRSSARNVPSGEERGETDVFAGYCSWFLPYFLLNLFTWQEKFLLFLRFLRNSRTSRSPSWPFLFVSVEFVKFVLLAIFAIFVAQSFHVARKILVTFAIFAKFAISSILLW